MRCQISLNWHRLCPRWNLGPCDRRLGCRALRLDSESKLEAAVHLYRAYGFAEIPRYNDNRRADIWMERPL